ncbi:MAG: MSCRAMM family protein [Microbacterium sp.]
MKLMRRSARRESTSQRDRFSRALRTLCAVLLALPLLLVGASPAAAAGGTLNLSVEAVNATVQSGVGASFRVQWTCAGSGSCDASTISIPVPVGVVPAGSPSSAFPGGVPLTVSGQSALQVGGVTVPGAATLTGTAPNQIMVWTFPAVVPTGTSGTVSFTLLAPNSVTPDDTTISPVATYAATGGTAVTATATTEVEAAVSLSTRKMKSSPTDVPYVDQQITYSILVGDDSQMPAAATSSLYARTMFDVCSQPGTQALQNLTVVDTLEPGATFVSANHGGVYDAAANTITWALGSSINDTAPYACRPYNVQANWVGSALQATVVYPSGSFNADPSTTAVTNSVVATANPWGQSRELSSEAAASHALREGSAGASVAKAPGYDWAVGNPLYREVATGENWLYYFHATSAKSVPGIWSLTDVMPCGLTSPTDADDTDCATPTFVDLQFSADGFLPAFGVNWTTNAGSIGSCEIAAGTSTSDTVKRFCDGTNGSTPTSVPAGEWITKIEIETSVPAFGGGKFYLHGRATANVPTSNVTTTYTNPNLVVERSDAHPWFVTAENCPAENVLRFKDGSEYLPDANQTRSHNGGICGYRQIMTNPFSLRPVKSMYDPAIPAASRPAVPTVQTGDTLTVDLTVVRSTWSGASAAQIAASTFTPTVTEYLPAGLSIVDGSLDIVASSAGNQPFVTALGEPHVGTEAVTYLGEPRTKVTVTFPDANITSSSSMNRTALVRFQVRVAAGVPAATYTNAYLLTGDEGGAGVDDTYLVCSTGTMVDADLQATTDRAVAIGCLASTRYTVLPVPGVGTSKTVEGAYDEAPITAPGVGSTDIGGEATYTIRVENSGSVDIRDVVAYDLLPRVGDTLTLPGGAARDSEFPVRLTGPIASVAGATVQYTTSTNPCRGDLAGAGGGAVGSAPTGCVNDWSATPPGGDYQAATGVRIDFGSRIFAAGDVEQIPVIVKAVGPNETASAAMDGIAWNNTAVFGREASSGSAILPTEASPVGLQVLPDVVWQKVDGRSGLALAGSVWELAPILGDGEAMPEGFPLTVADCTDAPCAGADQNAETGAFLLTGIAWGEYELTETTAPVGYVPLTESISVDLSPSNVDRDTFVLDVGSIENLQPVGKWTMSKSSDPSTGTVVRPGDTVTYTLTAVNASAAAVDDVVVTDDLSDVLDNASFGSFTGDDGALASRDGDTITWNVGTLAANSTRTVTYTVTVDEDAVGVTLRNVATGTGEEPPAECTTEEPCVTENPTPGFWTVAKTSDPVTGSTVTPGSTITYTLTASNDTGYPVRDVLISDDLSDVLDDATFGSFVDDDDGRAKWEGDALIWNVGTLDAHTSVAVSYTVKVKDGAFGVTLRNVVSGTGEVPPARCTTNDPCSTEHETPAGPGLAVTGGTIALIALPLALALVVGGSALLIARRRGSRVS